MALAGLTMNRRSVMACCLLAVAGCASNPPPPTPDPAAARIVTRTETVDVPVAAPREKPPELVSPIRIDAPTFLVAGQGDYGMTHIDAIRVLGIVSAFRAYYTTCSGYVAPLEPVASEEQK